jgi:hypothetical protein
MNSARTRFGAWLLLCAVLAVHIGDEAATDFLKLYNPAVTSMGWPGLRMTFPVWIGLLALGLAGLLILSVWVRRGTWWTIGAAYIFALLMASNALAHLIYSFHRGAWMSGSYTSPVLLGVSTWLGVTAGRHKL